MMDFINLKKGNMSVSMYSLKFSKLSKYALFLVAGPYAIMSKFILGIFNLVVKECQTSMLVIKMEHLLAYDLY